jgi:hypothetical protein
MFSEIELTGFQRLAAQLGTDQLPFKPSRQYLLNALASLLGVAEFYRKDAANRSIPHLRIPGLIPELEEELVPFGRDPVGTTLRLGIRRLGEIASGFMTIDEMVDLAEQASAECGDPGVRGCIVDKQWDGLRDHNGDYWMA